MPAYHIPDVETRLNDMAASGFLTQEQSDKMLTQLKDRMETEVPFGFGHHQGFEMGMGM